MNKILLFRFDSVTPNELDKKVLNSATKLNGESIRVESTPHGFVAILITNLDVGGLHIRYKRQERISKVRIPLFIFNLSDHQAKCSASIFNFNKISDMVGSIRPSLENTDGSCFLTTDQILEKIYHNGIQSLTSEERQKLDDHSRKLNEKMKDDQHNTIGKSN